MATTKKKRNKSAKPPTAKQLKARRAFTRMAKARAKEARLKKRLAARNGRSAVKRSPAKRRNSAAGESRHRASSFYIPPTKKSRGKSKTAKRKGGKVRRAITGLGGAIRSGLRTRAGVAALSRRRNKGTGVSCTKNGKKLFGAAAQAVLKARANRNVKRVKKVKKVGNKGFFSAPIGKRRRNQAPAGVAAMHETFLGQPVKSTKAIAAPDGTPRDVAVIGQIVELKSETETFNFKPGEAPLGANARGDLFVLGRTKVESNTDFGKLLELSYVAKKDQLNGKLTEYFHVFGEEGGRAPKLHTDREGMFHIVGGSYSIEAAGITD